MSPALPDPAPNSVPGPSRSNSGGAGGRPVLLDAAVVLGAFLVLGGVCAVLWALLVEPPTYTKTANGGTMGDEGLRRRFDADAWYAVLALVVGTVAGGVLTWWRSRDPVVTTLLIAVGSAAAAVVMATVGGALGPGNPDTALAAAKVGDSVPSELALSARVTLLTWPMGALFGALAVLWSTPGDAVTTSSGRLVP